MCVNQVVLLDSVSGKKKNKTSQNCLEFASSAKKLICNSRHGSQLCVIFHS